jgi:hypothetical protein
MTILLLEFLFFTDKISFGAPFLSFDKERWPQAGEV